jgi:hypothetical protein
VAWFPDLGSIDYFSTHERVPLLPVGWLDGVHEFATGVVATDDFARLKELLVDPWAPMHFMGWHECELGLHAGMSFPQVPSGYRNLFVPSGSVLYVAPEMILHYIEAHRYRPPDEFLTAIRECPPMGGVQYQRALDDAGAAGFYPAGVHDLERHFQMLEAFRDRAMRESVDPDS